MPGWKVWEGIRSLCRQEGLYRNLDCGPGGRINLKPAGRLADVCGSSFYHLVCGECRALGRLTSDIYGFINEMTEVVLLTAVYPYLQLNAGI